MPIKAQQNESGLSQHEQGSLTSMSDRLLDAFIFNSIHFWTGESPIKASDMSSDGTKVTTLGDTTIRWTHSEDGATVIYERHGIVERHAIAWMMNTETYSQKRSMQLMVVVCVS